MKTTKKTKLNTFALFLFTACIAFSLSSEMAYADDFGRIVRHVEVNYNVHRDHRFIMGFAGLVVKFWHVAGVKSFKGAIFENQHLDATGADSRLDEIIQSAGEHGWQPLVKSYSRRRGEHAFIYAKSEGKNVKLLIVSVDPNEAAIIQVKLDPDRMAKFMDEDMHQPRHGTTMAMSFR